VDLQGKGCIADAYVNALIPSPATTEEKGGAGQAKAELLRSPGTRSFSLDPEILEPICGSRVPQSC